MKLMFALPILVASLGYALPSQALQSCELKIDGERVAFAGRGADFYDRTVRKLSDGDACRSQGRKYGPTECIEAGGTTYTTIAVRNNGTRKVWKEVCS